MIPKTNEKHLQNNTIALLKAMGWQFITPKEMHDYRDNTSQVVLKDILLKRLQVLNSFEYKNNRYLFSDKNLAKAIASIDVPLDEGLSRANQKITDQLLLGNAFEEVLSDGVRKSFNINYIDFDNFDNNAFHFSEEFVVDRVVKNENQKTRRPDLVLFINGIPVGVVELKKSSVDTSQGVLQMIRNQKEAEIPQLFKYAQITLAGNNHTPKYATINTSKKFYASWIEEGGLDLTHLIEGRIPSALDKAVFSLFAKQRLIELIHSFILFDGGIKKISRYQQFFAIKEAMNKITKFDNTGRRVGGLIWHTQGSGKSLTMVMLAKEIKRSIVNAKIIVVTDRKDLDKQIHDTFKNSEIPAKKASSGRNLVELLQSGVSVITTIINKFEKVKNERVRLDDSNIFVLVDESHRSQNGDMSRAMNNVLVNACYIGFTGTPLMKKEKNSFKEFGGEIHRYTIDQAVNDKAILPLLYEGRFASQWITDKKSMDRRFDKIAKDLSDEQKLDLKKKWARFRNIAGSERRLEMIADDIYAHFKAQIQGTGFKAMLASSSKYEAIKYHQLFAESYPDIKTAFVISKSSGVEGEEEEGESEDNKAFVNEHWNRVIRQYGDEDKYLTKIKDEFVHGDEIDLLIVVNKLLTGFDAPRAGYLYIDKELKEHNLLQAIARVNRLYEGKDFGFIIDYRGLFGDLDKALTTYSGLSEFGEDDIVSVVFDIKVEIARVKTYATDLKELFADVNQSDQESYEVYLADNSKRKRFYDLLSRYARALKIALSSDKLDKVFSEDEIQEFKEKMRFYAQLRQSVKIRYFEVVDFAQYEKQMQKLLDTFISSDEVNQLTKTVNIFDDGFNQEVERLQGSNARADAILSASSAFISEKMDSNPAYYEKLSQKIKQIIDDYRHKRLSEEEKLANAKEIQKMLLKTSEDEVVNYPIEIRNNTFARIIYDNTADDFSELDDLEQVDFSLKVDGIFQQFNKRPDWQNSIDIKKQIDREILDLLWQIEDDSNIHFNTDEILDKVRSISINNL
ncbi:Type I restriction-modification system, restriction subunit R (EC 3.1.21.3) [uncultured Gammaproteobacteria bacterium]|jgi:type I restriction enzyme R subunit|nr:Type I restriction-modification system, restriction subunit R (EC 3.1.21.3) [uncultured Gammaproteobacteria bacterium]CAC9565681.1 Type I restriction-modification system, restriction subunit R (EC 3.1.21.3) [uncultured Gammaproteobacteria bacterium]